MTARVDAVATALVNAGLAGGSTGWPIQKLTARDTPDQCVVVAPAGGPEPEQDTERRWLRPRYQVLVRGEKQAGTRVVWDKAQAVLVALDRAAVTGFVNFTATQSEPALLGADADGRPQAVVNFRGDAS